MIVLDDNLNEKRVRQPVALWAKGAVAYLRELRPGVVIKDEAVPALLVQRRNPTFITTNVQDFWGKIAAHKRYCIICVPLPNNRQLEIPALLARLFRQRVRYYEVKSNSGKLR